MLKTDKEKRICEKYSARDNTGHVHCDKCPLFKGNLRTYDFRCKATCHFDRRVQDWVYDESYLSKSKEIVIEMEKLKRY